VSKLVSAMHIHTLNFHVSVTWLIMYKLMREIDLQFLFQFIATNNREYLVHNRVYMKFVG
jgi:hypothetical protein